jgi:hypothetical protein
MMKASKTRNIRSICLSTGSVHGPLIKGNSASRVGYNNVNLVEERAVSWLRSEPRLLDFGNSQWNSSRGLFGPAKEISID